MKKEEIDDQIRKWIQSDGLMEPPEWFSEMVLEKVIKEKNSAFRTEPIISAKQWIFIAAGFLILLASTFYGKLTISANWEQYFTVDIISVSLSQAFVYGLLTFTVFLFLQIYFIKNKVEEIYR